MLPDLRFEPEETALLTDFYELTMAASYFATGYNDTACFSLMTRRMPPRRGFLVAAGLERFLEALEDLRFDQSAIDYLGSLGIFAADFLDFLSHLRFTGQVRAVPEGTIFFAEEPIVEVRAPLIEAQLAETLALNQIGIASLIASKAARSLAVANGRRLIDFGLRRSQGADAGLIAARSSYLAGFNGSSNVLAGKRYGIPLYGTMAHSYVMAHDREREAFDNFVRTFPRLSTLLVDTYDTVRGVENAAATARELKQTGTTLMGIRLDSGNLLELSRKSRKILDEHGLNDVSIFASGNIDEYRIQELVAAGAPIDAFGVGTAMVVSQDAPALDVAYKLSEYNGKARLKTSENKLSLPGRKQVFRAYNRIGGFYTDLIGLEEEGIASVNAEFSPSPAETVMLLEHQMEGGRRLMPRPTLANARERFLRDFAVLDGRFKDLERPSVYPVRNTAALNALLISEKIRAEGRQD
ncbi:MAG: nicotinate phosphoribosyltransferase [Candidatus Binataceae bacterium]